MQKIVFNPHYMTYFDTAFSDYWRQLALPYEASMQVLGGELFMRKATLEYFASARYDDELSVGWVLHELGNSSCRFLGGIFRGDTLLTSGELVYVFADAQSQQAKPLPMALRQAFTAHQEKRPSVRIQTGPWSELEKAAAEVRRDVFVLEQGIPQEEEWDSADATACHAVALNAVGQAVATARLLAPTDPQSGVGRIGRMAVTKVLRGTGLGRGVFSALVNEAKARGYRALSLHAQCSAQKFYEQLGCRPQGEVFDEVGIAHIEMVLEIV
jgi:YbgC/YbaW family acyl-CoA thioester hydrolase